MHHAAIFKFGYEVHVRKRRREDAAADGEHFAADANGFAKIAGDVSKRREEKIAEVVADQAASGMKAILKEAAEESFVFRKGDHAVADVTWRKNAVFPAEAAGASAVIGDRDDRGEVGDGVRGRCVLIRTPDDVFLQAA